MDKNYWKVVETISQNEYKDVLLDKKCLMHLMNRIQSKDHRVKTFENNKICLSCFDDEIMRKQLSW